MTDSYSTSQRHVIALAGDLVSAYLSHNHVAPADVPALIASVHRSLAALSTGRSETAAAEPEKPSVAQIRRSVQDDRIISFIDGSAYKTLKRHLTAHGFTPATYRARYGLPDDYPLVAPAYSERRSRLAREHGLGIAANDSAPPVRRVS